MLRLEVQCVFEFIQASKLCHGHCNAFNHDALCSCVRLIFGIQVLNQVIQCIKLVLIQPFSGQNTMLDCIE